MSLWNYDKDEKKLNLIKIYNDLKNLLFFNFNDDSYKLIAINTKKFILYNMCENYELKKEEEFLYQSSSLSNDDNNTSIDKIKFAQNNEYFFILINQNINIYKKKNNKIKFKLCYNIESNICYSIFPFKKGIFLGCSHPFLKYLPLDENNKNISELEYYLTSENEQIFDYKLFQNDIIVLGNNKLIKINI